MRVSRWMLGVGVLLIVCGFLCGVLAGRAQDRLGPQMSLEEVLAFCKRKEATSWTPRELQTGPEFEWVRNHLDQLLEHDALRSSRCLSTMVWRAAFMFEDDDEIRRVAHACCARPHPGVPTAVPRDLATDPRVMTEVLFSKDTTDEFLCDFLYQVSDRAPWRWGYIDYTRTLKYMMHNAKSARVRASAAFCLARWQGDTPLGEEAQHALTRLCVEDPWIELLCDSLQTLGTRGWEGSASHPSR